MAKTNVKVGDVVKLKTGGPLMTVAQVDKGRATCLWFEGGPINWSPNSVFGVDLAALEKVRLTP
jgi:uncharacterized protein YodC (DUF2158 family)